MMNKYFEEMKRLFLEASHETKDTYEVVGFQSTLRNASYADFERQGADPYIIHQMMQKAQAGDKHEVVGPYHVLHYIDLAQQLNELKENICLENIESRQFVITFPKLHCFEAIQIMIRDKEIIAIGNMRSCDFIKNYNLDRMLTFYCGKIIQNCLEAKNICTIDKIHVIMNIGSLHIFKSEV